MALLVGCQCCHSAVWGGDQLGGGGGGLMNWSNPDRTLVGGSDGHNAGGSVLCPAVGFWTAGNDH